MTRRTPGESAAYSDGYLSALRYAVQLEGVDESARKKLRSLLEVHELFNAATKEGLRRTKADCPYSAHADDCDCNGMGGDR